MKPRTTTFKKPEEYIIFDDYPPQCYECGKCLPNIGPKLMRFVVNEIKKGVISDIGKIYALAFEKFCIYRSCCKHNLNTPISRAFDIFSQDKISPFEENYLKKKHINLTKTKSVKDPRNPEYVETLPSNLSQIGYSKSQRNEYKTVNVGSGYQVSVIPGRIYRASR